MVRLEQPSAPQPTNYRFPGRGRVTGMPEELGRLDGGGIRGAKILDRLAHRSQGGQ